MAASIRTLVRGDERIIAIIGAGGKTSLMFSLAHALREQGETVITATTTRIRVPVRQQTENLVLRVDDGYRDRLADGLARTGHVTVAEKRLPGEKLQGIAPAVLEKIFTASGADRLLIEADGARGLSLKAAGADEPVVPAGTDLCICLVGIDIIGRPLTSEHVFRPELVAARSGTPPGAAITPECVARLAVHARGLFKGCPQRARRVLFVNKTDIPGGRKKAAMLLAVLRGQAGGGIDRVVSGSVRKNEWEDILLFQR
jgi:probable selenium-dependent hydroxylase accessory protein YqeC